MPKKVLQPAYIKRKRNPCTLQIEIDELEQIQEALNQSEAQSAR
jgi:hypothetical protein